MSQVIDLKARLVTLTEERDYYASLVDAFLNGEHPSRGSLLHFIMAKWGRKRLEEIGSIPAILRSDSH